MIVSFADNDTFAFHRGDATTAFAEVARLAGKQARPTRRRHRRARRQSPSNHMQIVRKHRRRGRRWLIPLTSDWGVGFEWPPGSGGPVMVGVVGPPSVPPAPARAAA